MTKRVVKLFKATQRQLAAIDSPSVVVAAVLTVRSDEIEKFAPLGLAFADGKITTSEPAPPPRSCGRFANLNLDGWSEKRKDLPKELREISFWAPDWRGSGHHLVSRSLEAWPIKHHPARLNTLSATVLEHLKDAALVRFRIDQPLHRDSKSFAEDLSFNLSLLKEALGKASLFSSDLSDDEYARIQRVDWELLPPGSLERVLAKMATRRGVPAERLAVARERLQMLDRLNHDGFLVGTGGFANYFGVRFGDQLVVLESLQYGNGLYAFEANWEQLSKISRRELIKRRDQRVHRVPHIPGWQSVIRKLARSV